MDLPQAWQLGASFRPFDKAGQYLKADIRQPAIERAHHGEIHWRSRRVCG
jgi:hypothetical protein